MNHDEMRFIESIKYIASGTENKDTIQNLDTRVNVPGDVSKTADGTYVIKYKPGWLRGNNRKDIVGSMIIAPGETATFKKGVIIGSAHSITITASTDFDFGFMKSSISAAFGVTVDETVTIIHGITYTSPENKYTYIRMFATYTKYEVIKIRNNTISRGFVFKGEGLYEKKIEFNEGELINQELLDENSERCVFDGSEGVSNIIDTTEKLETNIIISNNTFTHETQQYDNNVSLNIPFTVVNDGYYQINNTSGKNHMILYRIVNVGSLQKPIKNIIANSPGYEFDSSKNSILANLRTGENYLLVFPELKNGKDIIVFKKTSGSINTLQNCGFITNMTLPMLHSTYELQFDKVGAQLALDISTGTNAGTYRIYTKKGICTAILYEYNNETSNLNKIKDFTIKFEAEDIYFDYNKRYILLLTNEGNFYGNTDLILRNNIDGNYKINTSIDSSKAIMKDAHNIKVKSYVQNSSYSWLLKLNAIKNGYEVTSVENSSEYMVWDKMNDQITICNKRNLTNRYAHIWDFVNIGSNLFKIINVDQSEKVISLERNTDIEGSNLILKDNDNTDTSKFTLTRLQ